ncbi:MULTISPECIES: esterase family protein [unclassified Streptomyces]|uniref:alpha/beta hydrolase n=1 Tax=unclassified Streptomyces TaxID=2593676 RepID=UPI0022548793|nr:MULTISPECIES: alpha/beta hydrolase-fold protein [unclassified Streptomyces]MCX4527293.1 alpha/beta hydrolase-fold protein [Streptomyces sp. NBC_01551]MCX4542127.1 alpha/beta hydrolase-fold protein [Streptomyces sp. NBC_01565]
MGLTSNTVLALAIVAGVLLFAATVWFWPKLSGRTWRAFTGRIGLLLATQLALFSAVGLAANKSFLFYGSWADLFGQETSMGKVVDHSMSSKDIKVVDKQKLDVPGGGKPQVGGQILKVAITGEKSKITSPGYVWLPPEYFQPQHKHQNFPAAIVLTGYPGTAENLIKGLNYPMTAFKQAKQGKMKPMILVMLRPTVAPPRDTECVDIPDGPQTETFFGHDLPKAIQGTFRVGDKPRNMGFIGNSTGGYCALKIATHYPQTFGAAAGLSAYYEAPDDPTTGNLFHGDEKLKKRADVLESIGKKEPIGTSFLVTSSQKGEPNLADTKKFIKKVKSPDRVSSIILESGGHNFNTWRREIAPMLVWMSDRIQA